MSFWKKLIGQDEELPLDPLTDLVLEKLRPGYLVDYDAMTWEVKAQHRIDSTDGFRTEEWELASESERCFLDHVEGDSGYWTLTRRVPMGIIDERLRGHIARHGDPPEALNHDGVRYFRSSSGGAKFYKHGQGPALPFLYWEYEDESGRRILVINQWGDDEFEAYAGDYVEEYQFINILPARRR